MGTTRSGLKARQNNTPLKTIKSVHTPLSKVVVFVHKLTRDTTDWSCKACDFDIPSSQSDRPMVKLLLKVHKPVGAIVYEGFPFSHVG